MAALASTNDHSLGCFFRASSTTSRGDLVAAQHFGANVLGFAVGLLGVLLVRLAPDAGEVLAHLLDQTASVLGFSPPMGPNTFSIASAR